MEHFGKENINDRNKIYQIVTDSFLLIYNLALFNQMIQDFLISNSISYHK